MFRLLGFLIGSVSSIVIILLIVGMPDFHPADKEIDQQRYDAAIEKLRAKQNEFESVAGRLSNDVARVAEAVEDRFVQLTDDVPLSTGNVMPLMDETRISSPADEEPAVPGYSAGKDSELLWFSFWNPFHSEIAANGFVSQLEKVTGIDYRVVKVKIGVYEVAFAYNDDVEKHARLSQISAATGLDLPES